MANVFYLHQFAKAEETGLINFIPYPQPVGQTKNCHLPTQSLALTRRMENRWPLFLNHRPSVTGKDTVVAGRRIFTYSILLTKRLRISLPATQQDKNFPCGTITTFTFYQIVDPK